MTRHSTQPVPRILLSGDGRGWRSLDADLLQVPAGLARVPGRDRHTLGIHVGPPVRADCSVGGMRMRRLQKPGDMDFIPAGMDGSWEDAEDCQILRLGMSSALLTQVIEELGGNAAAVQWIPRLQLRDAGVEAIGQAIKADLQAHTPSDPLYIDSLTHALAVRLVEVATDHRSLIVEPSAAPKLANRTFTRLVDFIECNLDNKLLLADLALVAGVSATRLKVLFRNTTGLAVHQYVIHRRLERARALIATRAMPLSQIALAAGFAHQSHMATTMRRVLGLTPSQLVRLAK